VPVIDLVDETFIAATPEVVAAVVHESARWSTWWPDLTLTVFMDRGLSGIRWSAQGAAVGSCELWLEAVGDGVLVHHYVRLDPIDKRTGAAMSVPQTPAGWRKVAALRAARARDWKLHVWALKDELEGDRRPGTAVSQTPA
jgi:hypothetical protein